MGHESLAFEWASLALARQVHAGARIVRTGCSYDVTHPVEDLSRRPDTKPNGNASPKRSTAHPLTRGSFRATGCGIFVPSLKNSENIVGISDAGASIARNSRGQGHQSRD
jgi:hypothetical protein